MQKICEIFGRNFSMLQRGNWLHAFILTARYEPAAASWKMNGDFYRDKYIMVHPTSFSPITLIITVHVIKIRITAE